MNKSKEINNRINGKVIVITGASSGMGKAISITLAAHGAKVVLGARRQDHLEVVAAQIRENGGEVVFLKTDVTQHTNVNALAALAQHEFGQIDVMINNAGIAQLSLMEEVDVMGWIEMIDVNLKGTLFGIAAVLPIFKMQGFGHIINIISVAGLRIVPSMGVYAGVKNAVRTISEGLRQESRGRWRVTGISPGFVNTSFAENIKNENMRIGIQQKSFNRFFKLKTKISPSMFRQSLS
jgi:NADP-dependent 3-hydroxy acid dehydrogenase YdfG